MVTSHQNGYLPPKWLPNAWYLYPDKSVNYINVYIALTLTAKILTISIGKKLQHFQNLLKSIRTRENLYFPAPEFLDDLALYSTVDQETKMVTSHQNGYHPPKWLLVTKMVTIVTKMATKCVVFIPR